jgi:hypothetical protein
VAMKGYRQIASRGAAAAAISTPADP